MPNLYTSASIVAVAVVLIAIVLFYYFWSFYKETLREKFFRDRTIMIMNFKRLLKTDYIPISLENIKTVRENIEEVLRLENKLTYPDCPNLELRDKERIKSLLADCVVIYENAGVPLDRIIKDTSIRYGS